MNSHEKICRICKIKPKYFAVYRYMGIDVSGPFSSKAQAKRETCFGSPVIKEVYPTFTGENLEKLLNLRDSEGSILFKMSGWQSTKDLVQGIAYALNKPGQLYKFREIIKNKRWKVNIDERTIKKWKKEYMMNSNMS